MEGDDAAVDSQPRKIAEAQVARQPPPGGASPLPGAPARAHPARFTLDSAARVCYAPRER